MKVTTRAIVALGASLVKLANDTDAIIAMYTEAGTASAVVAAAIADCIADKVLPKETIVGWCTSPVRRGVTKKGAPLIPVSEKEHKVMNAINALRSRAIYHFNKIDADAETARFDSLSDTAKAEIMEATANAIAEKATKPAVTDMTEADCLARLYVSAHATGKGKALKYLALAAKEMGLELPTV